jgi:hypothetical protein
MPNDIVIIMLRECPCLLVLLPRPSKLLYTMATVLELTCVVPRASGESAQLHCRFPSKENHRANWLKDGVPLEVLINLHYSLFDKHSLLIKGTSTPIHPVLSMTEQLETIVTLMLPMDELSGTIATILLSMTEQRGSLLPSYCPWLSNWRLLLL